MSTFNIDEEAIRKLAGLLQETGLTEIELEEDDRSIRVSRAAPPGVAVTAAVGAPLAMPATTGAGHAHTAPAPDLPAGTQVTSPMVGTVYLAGTPGAAPFVKAGDTVKEGDTLLIVEAMKVMNPIKAPKGGTIVRLAVSDAQPVEFGELLVIIG